MSNLKEEERTNPSDMSSKLDSVFTVGRRQQDMENLPVLKSEVVSVRSKRKGASPEVDVKSPWETLVGAADSLNQDTRKMFRFVKKKLRKRRNGETEVKTIHIVPEDDESKWARRSASSAASRTSTDTACSSSSREETSLQVVHDLAEETIVGCD